MGLSAGQARLLTITGRKSDCEFQSMRLSHQKIALTRQLADLSNEYQNSLDQTKLIYDFYGTGDTSTQLSYNLLMSPSALNNYMPTLITDSLGRVTLNSNLAKAARAAGIPQEGLGSLPSDTMRNNFIKGLASSGVITTDMANKILGLPYNQSIGFGGGTTVATTTQSGTLDDFCDYLEKTGAYFNITLSKDKVLQCRADQGSFGVHQDKYDGVKPDKRTLYVNNDTEYNTSHDFNIAEILKGDHDYLLDLYSKSHSNINEKLMEYGLEIADNIIDQLAETLSGVLDLGDGYTAKALDYAVNMTRRYFAPTDKDGKYITEKYTNNQSVYYNNADRYHVKDYVGWVRNDYKSSDHRRHVATLSLSNMISAFLTYFEDYKNGVSTLDSYGQQYLDVDIALKQSSKLVTDKKDYMYTWKTGSEVSSDDMGQAAFYDALFNQLCARGWTENDDITKNQYLQEMLQSGRLYVSRTKDDGYYYQGNYSTDSYIKEVADETLIAHAEAKYNTEKAKLNQKEEMLDLKMKNLDTEISSLTTEYDTVKNTISKNIEKSFKRYNA